VTGQVPSLYVLCGVPFAGKSTLGRILSARIGAELVEYDEINTERGLGLDREPIVASEFEATEREAFGRIAMALAQRRDVVYDAVNFLRSQRDALRDIAARTGAEAVLIWVGVPSDIALIRWRSNRLTGVRADVRDADFMHVVSNFEPPAPDEGALHFDGTQAADPWLELYVR
jgi:predicted kinase